MVKLLQQRFSDCLVNTSKQLKEEQIDKKDLKHLLGVFLISPKQQFN
jgi:hypothetical protein